jgi:hypothetical protein
MLLPSIPSTLNCLFPLLLILTTANSWYLAAETLPNKKSSSFLVPSIPLTLAFSSLKSAMLYLGAVFETAALIRAYTEDYLGISSYPMIKELRGAG